MAARAKGAKGKNVQEEVEAVDAFGLFVNLEVRELKLELESAPAAPVSAYLSFQVPGAEKEAAKSAPIEISAASCSLEVNYSTSVQYKEVPEGLLATYLNNMPTIALCEAATGQKLAVAHLDMLQFALGASSIQLDAAELATPPAVVGKEGSGAKAAVVLPKLVQPDARLSGVTVSMQHRQRPPPPDPSVVQASRPASGRKEANQPQAGAATAAAPDEASLPPLEPFAFVSPDDAKHCNVVEMSVHSIAPLPPKLLVAADAVKGGLAFAVGVQLGDGDTAISLHLADGKLEGSALSFPTTQRQYMSPEATRDMLFALRDAKPTLLEVARYISPPVDTHADPAFKAYHAAVDVGVAFSDALTEPGSTESTFSLLLATTFESEAAALAAAAGEAAAAAAAPKSCLPTYNPPEKSKVKNIEELPAPAVPGGPTPCAWAASGAVLQLTLRLARPLVPPWVPPPRPATTLAELVPPRVIPKKADSVEASEEFRQQVATVAKALAAEYHRAYGSDPAGTAPSADVIRDRHRALIFELNSSGKYLQLKDSLKQSVVRVVQEKYRKTGAMGPSEMSELYNDLYVHLLDQMHVALTALTDSTPKPRPAAAPDASSLAALKALADEVEVSGQAAARAEAVHQRRVLDDRNPAAWYDYGSFCLRAGKRGRGEECLREALAVDPRHRPSLLGLCCLCLAQGQLSDAMFYESAEVLAHELKEAEPTSPLAWGLLSLIYRGMGGAKAAEAEAAHRGVMKFCKERRAADKAAAAADVNGYYMAAEALASLCLPEATIKACALVDTLKLTKGQLAGEVALLQGEALRQMGNVQKALAAADAAARSLPVGDFRPRLLSASIHYSAKAWSDAGFGYQTVLTEAPAACSLEVYLRLGQCYLQLGRYIDAEHVFTAACAACGCASTWLGAGVAALRRGDLAAADLALTEANVLDPDHPAAWGHLALLSLKAGRVAEAESALKYAQKAGLSDSALELELGEELLALGQHLAAQTVAARVSAREPSFRSRLLQGKALIARKEAAAAKAELDEAAALAKTADEQSALSAAMDDLNTLPPSL